MLVYCTGAFLLVSHSRASVAFLSCADLLAVESADLASGGPLKRASSAESFASETELHRVELEREFSGFRTEQLECFVQYIEYVLCQSLSLTLILTLLISTSLLLSNKCF